MAGLGREISFFCRKMIISLLLIERLNVRGKTIWCIIKLKQSTFGNSGLLPAEKENYSVIAVLLGINWIVRYFIFQVLFAGGFFFLEKAMGLQTVLLEKALVL